MTKCTCDSCEYKAALERILMPDELNPTAAANLAAQLFLVVTAGVIEKHGELDKIALHDLPNVAYQFGLASAWWQKKHGM